MMRISFILVAFGQSNPAEENLVVGVTLDGAGEGDRFPIDFATEKNETWYSDLTGKNLTTDLTHGSESDVIHVDLSDKLQRTPLLIPIMLVFTCKKAYDWGMKYGNSRNHPRYSCGNACEWFKEQYCCDPMQPPPEWESCKFPDWGIIAKLRQAKQDKLNKEIRNKWNSKLDSKFRKRCETAKWKGHPDCVKGYDGFFSKKGDGSSKNDNAPKAYVPPTCDESSCSCFEDIDPSEVSKRSSNTKTGYLVDWSAGIRNKTSANCFISVTLYYNGDAGSPCCDGYTKLSKSPGDDGDVGAFLLPDLCGKRQVSTFIKTVRDVVNKTTGQAKRTTNTHTVSLTKVNNPNCVKIESTNEEDASIFEEKTNLIIGGSICALVVIIIILSSLSRLFMKKKRGNEDEKSNGYEDDYYESSRDLSYEFEGEYDESSKGFYAEFETSSQYFEDEYESASRG